MDQLPPYPEVPRVVAPEKPSRLFLWLGLGVGALLVATLVGGYFTVSALLANTPLATLEDEDPGCFGTCFSIDEAESLVPSPAALDALGAQAMEGYGPGYRQTIGDVYTEAQWQWSDGEGEPHGCSFALAYGPVTSANALTTDQRSDPTIGLGSYGTESSNVYQLVRVFGSQGEASAYPGELRDSLAGCTHYSVDLGYDERYETEVLPAEISVPFGTATVVAWREYDGYNHVTVADLQYANLVIRSIFVDAPGTGISDAEFDAFIAETARAMVALDPKPQGSPVPEAGCSSSCLTIEDVATLAPDADELALLGGVGPTAGYVLEQPQPIGVYADTAAVLYGDGVPETCAFVMSWAPISPSSPTAESRDDLAVDLGAFGEATNVSQTARLFGSTVWASRYTSSVTDALSDCPSVRVEFEDSEPYIADLAPTEFETAPGVASAAWIETSAAARVIVVDLRFDTVVVRTVLNQADASVISDAQFAEFILDTSHRMAALGDG